MNGEKKYGFSREEPCKKEAFQLTPEDMEKSKELFNEYKEGVKKGEITPSSKNKKGKVYGYPSIGELGEGGPSVITGETEEDQTEGDDQED